MKHWGAIATLAMTFGSILWALASDISSLKQFKTDTEVLHSTVTDDIREIRAGQTQILQILINRD